MLMFAFTYHQIMAEFTEFLFPFGKQDYPQDFHFSGLRQEIRLCEDEKGLDLSNIGRSGQDFRMCYNLKSVESSPIQKQWPWSIRQCAVYHSFDIKTGRGFWLIIKADELIKNRIKDATNPTNHPNLDLNSISNAFSETLNSQLVIINWCRESWRWYLSALENVQEQATRRAKLIRFDKPVTGNQQPNFPRQRTTTLSVNKKKHLLPRIVRQATGILTPEPMELNQTHPQPQPRPPPEFEEDFNNNEIFSFSDVQQLQDYQEKIYEVLLVLSSNMKILEHIREYYAALFKSVDLPEHIKNDCSKQFSHFQNNINDIINDLEIQRSRGEMLLSTVANRTNLVNILLSIIFIYLF